MNAWDSIAAFWRQGGPLMPAIAVVSVGIWFYFLRSRRLLLDALAEARTWEARLDAGPLAPPIAASADVAPGLLGTAIEAAVRAWRRRESPTEAFERLAAAVLKRLGRDLVMLRALTAVAPLLGLLGTVVGMIATFEAVARVTGDPAANISGGISQALITTQFGLVVAIPGVFGVARLQRLIDQARVRIFGCRSRLALWPAGAGAAG